MHVAQLAELRLQPLQLGDLRQRAATVRELVQLGVQRLKIEQAQLVGGLGIHVAVLLG